jgi:hypothetical protein
MCNGLEILDPEDGDEPESNEENIDDPEKDSDFPTKELSVGELNKQTTL